MCSLPSRKLGTKEDIARIYWFRALRKRNASSPTILCVCCMLMLAMLPVFASCFEESWKYMTAAITNMTIASKMATHTTMVHFLRVFPCARTEVMVEVLGQVRPLSKLDISKFTPAIDGRPLASRRSFSKSTAIPAAFLTGVALLHSRSHCSSEAKSGRNAFSGKSNFPALAPPVRFKASTWALRAMTIRASCATPGPPSTVM
mmetsp:Transcript_68687/g.108196  ORF Transcript_68687/g.108196 Transcript_68687/m.108196 type:complete len:203 (-) Transcript_68687:153-761(-)